MKNLKSIVVKKKSEKLFIPDHVVYGVKKPEHILNGSWKGKEGCLADILTINQVLKKLSKGDYI